MSVYAIGDLQGCYDSLQKLLSKLDFDPSKDTLWLVGDLVNRGNKSLKTLRFIKSLGDSAITVLGNHDLHLLAVANNVRKQGQGDTLKKILNATDSLDLINWLRHRPLIHQDKTLGFTMVHAGISPQWSIKKAKKYASEVESVLRSGNYIELLANMYGNKPNKWKSNLKGLERQRLIINCFTRTRYCQQNGTLDFQAKGRPGYQNKGLVPWYQLLNSKKLDTRIIFGHWSALGYLETDSVIALDTGCVWGRRLTAIKLKKRQVKRISIKC